ncbi:WecB/TagA/CpsF family glycosyltransferase [Caballeronia glebae]|uniref:UDP-Gal:alpha-D-GlcNAc-diphosphoundecaprenol beta-1,4-galactosyltransferase n=1 Tax=Caballeronia glebae TaxID=1777143 RepID=A0A158C5E5_9BURK|nr:WecB/TagA/CpsF family glycosyltransferase [Caballeronia glebae]SAK77511.1 UDP-Gal:alpha-D-GlcNAc-diphosphoundecaprenol beta-1,4-galactosyltransferase [Caballeronia glebae]
MNSENDDCSGQSVIFLNPHSYMILREHPDLFATNSKVGIDGQVLVRILSLFWSRHVDRVSFDMTSLAPRVFQDAAASRKRVYIIGSTQASLDRSLSVLVGAFPELDICGSRNGYFLSEVDRISALHDVMESEANVIICGMGSPHQERFLHELRALGWTGTGYTCGGFLHQTAKRGERYYPRWIDRLQLRWAYRIYDEPKLFKRYFFGYPIALLFIVKDCVGYAMGKLWRSPS